MGITLVFVGICVAFGVAAAFASSGPLDLPQIPRPLSAKDIKRFTPRKTLFIIGPKADHAACRMQRRLLKPAIALIIREDIKIIELYGDEPARLNGDEMDWLDPSLLRHAMNAEEGFFVIYVDERGRTAFRTEAPMVASDLFARAGVRITRPEAAGLEKSSTLRKLRAA